jgi:hypothetical protein
MFNRRATSSTDMRLLGCPESTSPGPPLLEFFDGSDMVYFLGKFTVW